MLRVVGSQPARPKAPARKLGSMARACVADGSKNVGLYNAANQNPKNSERDAHRLFAKYWLSLKVPISFIEVPPENDGIFSSIPFYKARWFCRCKSYRAKNLIQKFWESHCSWISRSLYAEETTKDFWEQKQKSITIWNLGSFSYSYRILNNDATKRFSNGATVGIHNIRKSRALPTKTIFGV